MEASILIVSKNRKDELQKTLLILEKCVSKKEHEILVFLDGCTDESGELKQEFPWVQWYSSEVSIGASRARNLLYKKARGSIFFGFDDDAHPMQEDFISKALGLFRSRQQLGIIAFRELRGKNIDNYLGHEDPLEEDYLTKDFMGCGFAIRKDVYMKTAGFPKWIDIYGEEICVALEVLNLNHEILFTYKIVVNHRVDTEARKLQGGNYFRFGRQLKNTANFYLVYYPFPLLLKKVARLYFLNLFKYGFKNWSFFKEFWKSLYKNIIQFPVVIRYRRPVSSSTIQKFNSLPNPKY
ncbi:glycosyltransferase family 2 protein [Salinimicrobium sediminilitoris]|uniref:glycosyltransferase family 2 protein n=1 Tax=Salinimicrobium sediminilitoris TaxID=2876715 RepID=UPI001E642E36|nr:glycosyltransferase [Salinimicrobium sediminilitoris]MCC8358530.1 glycosyltransferase [Salinimicrobium sediminilitoris]